MDNQAVEILKDGGIGVLQTDTLYGLVASALDKKAVAKVYKVKGRNNKKPFIILISNINDLEMFDVKANGKMLEAFDKYWPGPVSLVLPCKSGNFEYLHRGLETLAFRLPKKTSLIKILQKTGPLVAPSANAEGHLPARNITEAKRYFGDNVDFYQKGTRARSRPSALIKVESDRVTILRR